MMFGTVGVAPGSFTFNSGGQLLGACSCGDGSCASCSSCAEDVDGPYGYGLPSRHRYEAASHWYNCQFAAVPQRACGGPSAAGPSVTLDPYGTDSTLQGRSLADAATFMGIRLDVLGVVAAAAVGIGLAVSHFAKKPRRRR